MDVNLPMFFSHKLVQKLPLTTVVCVSEPCAEVILSAAAFRVILTGGGGAPIDFFRHQLNVGGGGVHRRGRQ